MDRGDGMICSLSRLRALHVNRGALEVEVDYLETQLKQYQLLTVH